MYYLPRRARRVLRANTRCRIFTGVRHYGNRGTRYKRIAGVTLLAAAIIGSRGVNTDSITATCVTAPALVNI
jgi:hypothetical protein